MSSSGIDAVYLLAGRVGGTERCYLLRPGLNRIGRHPGSDIVLPIDGVSKRHAVLVVSPGSLRLQDVASKNGTFLAGRRTLDVEVRPGDELGFGPVRLILAEAEPDEGTLAVELSPAAAKRVEVETTVTPSRGAPHSAWEGSLRFPDGHFPGDSPPMRDLYRQMASIARSELPVLIVGETGVGKEAVARTIHASSGRGHRSFAAVSCAAVPRDLLEAELFGVAAGAATGVAARAGVLRSAAGGTVLLDEIGEMPIALQAKLLRALQEKVAQPLGAPPMRVDVRVLAATNARLDELIATGAFRRDLYYRLAGCVLTVPPLRERREDLPTLIEHLLRRAAREAATGPRGLTTGAARRLCREPWPGNVRQLEHAIQRLVYLAAESETITERTVEAALRSAELASPPGGTAIEAGRELDLAALERRAIAEALRRSQGNQAQAARLLGISRYALRRRIERDDRASGESA